MTKEYERRIISMIVLPKGEPIYSELATTITIEDESAGEFIKISQTTSDEVELAFDREEWLAVRDAVDLMFDMCRKSDD